MKKNTLIISTFVVVALAVVYSGFWFFKASQFKRQIANSVQKSDAKLSVGEVAVSGFPLAQKFVFKDLKIAANSNVELTFKNIEVRGNWFGHKYSMKIPQPIIFHGKDFQTNARFEMSADTQIFVETTKDNLLQIKYFGQGYKVFDNDKNILVFSLESQNSETEILLNRAVAQENKGQENFNKFFDLFVGFKHSDLGTKIFDEKNNLISSVGSSSFDIRKIKSGDEKSTIKFDLNFKDYEFFGLKSAEENLDGATAQDANASSTSAVAAPSDKSNFIAVGEVLFDRNSFAANIKNIEFTNSLYKIFINAAVANYPEDRLPSGLITLKIENFDNIAKIIFDKIQERQPKNPQISQGESKAQKTFDDSIKIIKDLALKNAQSTENLMVFEVKREKNDNINTTINGVSFMEIMMNARMQNQAPQAASQPQQNINPLKTNQIK